MLNFIQKEPSINIGDAQLTFYRKGFTLNEVGSSPSYIDVILSGVSPLTLVNAIEDGLNYLKLFGGTEQRNLPSGYTQVEYLQSDGAQYIDTGIILGSSAVELFVDYKINMLKDYGSTYGARTSSTNSRFDIWTQANALGGYGFDDTSVQSLTKFNTNRETLLVTRTSVLRNGVSDVPSYNNTATISYSMYLFGTNNSGSFINTLDGRIYKAYIKKDNILSFNGIPARRNSDNVLGMYDTVTGNFLTNAGTGTFTAGADVVPTPDAPIDIVCNNGALKVNTNLYSTEYHDSILAQDDGVTVRSASGVNVSEMVDCRTIKSFKITDISPQGSFRIFKYSADNTYIDASSTADIGDIITFENNVGFFRIQYNYIAVGTENILIYNSAYDLNGIYTDGTQEVVTDSLGNTANAERLLAVGDYKDTQEVLTGSVTRNVGVKVLDGTEDWTYDSRATLTRFTTTISDFTSLGVRLTPMYCTQLSCISDGRALVDVPDNVIYSGDTVETPNNIYIKATAYTSEETFKQYLSDQYAAGTPVIIVYPLATATTESVTGQPLTVQAGTNIVEITEASISNLTMEASFKQQA